MWAPRALSLLALVVAAASGGAPRAEQVRDAELAKVDGVKCPSAALKRAGAVSGAAQYLHAGLALTRAGHGAKARACLGHVFKADAGRSAWAWGILGELLSREGADAGRAGACFAEAARVGEPIVPHSTYDVLGPFPIGKMEFDGDPLESALHGGVDRARAGSSRRFPSEFAEGGFVLWQVHPAGATKALDVSFPHIQWNKHLQLTNSMPILEWQSWAVADFLVTEPAAARIDCAGVHSFSVDRVGDPWYAGDIYRSGLFGTTLQLQPGVHTILARVKAKVSTTLRCQVRQAPAADNGAEVLELTAPQWMPDVVAGDFVGEGLTSVILLNLHPALPLTNVSVSIPVKAASKKRPYVALDGGRQRGGAAGGPSHVAPGQAVGIHVALKIVGGDASKRDDDPALCPAPFRLVVRALVGAGGRQVEVESDSVAVRCRRRSNQSFLLSFLYHDGSVNRAAVIPPLEGCRRPSTAAASATAAHSSCPVVLTMHGTGVTENNQADAYKHEVGPDVWEFGVRGAWLLAPTRFGAHNWEGTGARKCPVHPGKEPCSKVKTRPAKTASLALPPQAPRPSSLVALALLTSIPSC